MLIPTITSVMALPRVRVLRAGMAGIRQMVVVAVLALALALSGQARALPLVHSAGMGAVVICSDMGMQTIYLDASGAPAKFPSDCATCPECTAAPALFTPPPPVGAAARGRAGHDPIRLARQAVPPSRHLRPETRGPPPEARAVNDMAPAAVPQFAAPRHSTGPCHRIGRSQTEARA